jgi:hypothetical protein
MFVKSIKMAQSAMFPIFRLDQITNQQARIAVVGTGFFINSHGYFVSAAHVFDNPTLTTKYPYFGRLPDELRENLMLEEVCRDDDYDVIIGKVNVRTFKYFHLNDKLPPIGRSVCIGGYPLANITANQQGGIELGGVRRYFQPTFVLDWENANSTNQSSRVRKHEGFLVRDVGLFGMSGGPVFTKNGQVIGLQGSVTQPRISSSAGRTITVENALVIKSRIITSLLDKYRIRFNLLGLF